MTQIATGIKIRPKDYCLKVSMSAWCVVSLVKWWCVCVYSLLDASVAEEDIGGNYYYQEEEEENPGHFANQGKPSFDSYSHYLVLLLHATCLSKLHDWIARVEW
jgi:hypothetical protein